MTDAPEPGAVRPELPGPVLDAVRAASETLAAALRPHMNATNPSPDIDFLWQTSKLLLGLGGGWSATPDEHDKGFADWYEVAGISLSNARRALAIAAEGLTMEQATKRVEDADVLAYESAFDEAAAYGATVDVQLPDHEESSRTITVTIDPGTSRALSTSSNIGAAPVPRPHTPATLLQTATLVRELGDLLGSIVREPYADGFPAWISPHRETPCAVCETTLAPESARKVYVGPYWSNTVEVCSVICARAAHAGEHSTYPTRIS